MAAISNRLRRLIFSGATSEDVIRLVTISDPGWVEPLRFCDVGLEMEALETGVRRFTVSNGVTYEHGIVSSMSGDDEEDSLPSSQLVLDNVAYRAGDLLEEDLTGATVDLVLVAKSDPNEVVEEILGWEIVSGEASEEAATFEVALDPDDESEPAVAWTMNRGNARGLFL